MTSQTDVGSRSAAHGLLLPQVCDADRALRPGWLTPWQPLSRVLTGIESLTASERRIAHLGSQGLTNREIAQTLFVTARTVEGHPTSVFRKLRLESRSELGALFDAGNADLGTAHVAHALAR